MPANTDPKEKLIPLRERIDEIDSRLISLFAERMEIAEQVAKIKREYNIPILDEERERQVVERAAALAGENLRAEAQKLMYIILELSRKIQAKNT